MQLLANFDNLPGLEPELQRNQFYSTFMRDAARFSAFLTRYGVMVQHH
jgi:hypothetical protein